MADAVAVEVVYALLERQELVRLELAAGSNVEQAIRASGLLQGFPEIDLAVNPVGIFGKLVSLAALLCNGDRVEIYRPLYADPRDMRRQRAARIRPKGD